MAVIAGLASLPTMEGRPFGAAAKNLTAEEARRIGSRMARQSSAGVGSFQYGTKGASDLATMSTRRHRSRNTHPGKRGKAVRF